MKILLDTSVLLPGFRYPDVRRKLIWKIIDEGMTPVLSDHILEELRVNIEEQYSDEEKRVALDLLLQILQISRVEVKSWEEYAPHLEEASKLTNEKDAPILAATMLEDIDYLITRDKKAFLENKKLWATPWQQKIYSPQDFLEQLRRW